MTFAAPKSKKAYAPAVICPQKNAFAISWKHKAVLQNHINDDLSNSDDGIVI